MNIIDDVKEILMDIFDNKKLIITESTCSEDVEEWDSLAQMNIIVALSKHFKIKFTMEEIGSLQNVGDIVKSIEKKLSI